MKSSSLSTHLHFDQWLVCMWFITWVVEQWGIVGHEQSKTHEPLGMNLWPHLVPFIDFTCGPRAQSQFRADLTFPQHCRSLARTSGHSGPLNPTTLQVRGDLLSPPDSLGEFQTGSLVFSGYGCLLLGMYIVWYSDGATNLIIGYIFLSVVKRLSAIQQRCSSHGA